MYLTLANSHICARHRSHRGQLWSHGNARRRAAEDRLDGFRLAGGGGDQQSTLSGHGDGQAIQERCASCVGMPYCRP
jgi:hypothetical protein